jgi:protein-S-isoprenylcysteine O-methyltransferase Ste14
MINATFGYVLLAVFVGLEFFFRRGKEARSLKPGASDQGTTILIGVSYPIGILLPLMLNYFSVGRSPDAEFISTAGVGVMVLGLAIRLWSMQTLGRFYTRTLTVSEGQKIVQAGPYHIIRHPGYLGTLLVWIGLPTSQANWIAACLVVLFMGVAYLRRIKAEETMLMDRFGEEYRQYMKRTWRLVPFIF